MLLYLETNPLKYKRLRFQQNAQITNRKNLSWHFLVGNNKKAAATSSNDFCQALKPSGMFDIKSTAMKRWSKNNYEDLNGTFSINFSSKSLILKKIILGEVHLQ